MHRDLTVRENLRFYAHLKAHPQMTRNQRRAFVNEIIDILGLSHVQHSLIGDEETRGISGGQRKRVNIGIELMASPLILFLDEPTSGLDSTTTQQLIDSLEKLTQLGLTIAMVIHQVSERSGGGGEEDERRATTKLKLFHSYFCLARYALAWRSRDTRF